MSEPNQPEPEKPLCPGAWAIPPSPRMLKHGNDYHTCSICNEPCDVVDLKPSNSTELKPDTQADLIDFVTDPETIAKAVEGSMDKRMAVQAEAGLQQTIKAELSRAYYNGLDKKGWSLYEEKDAVNKIMALFQADKAAAVVEAEIRAIDLLRWKYKELNNQTVDMKFVEAHTLLKDELTGKSNTTPCGYCGTPVEPVVTVTQKKYCNHSHRQLAYKARLQPPTAGEGESV